MPESFGGWIRTAGGLQSEGLPGTAIVGVGASIQLYEETLSTSVMDASSDNLRSWRPERGMVSIVREAIFLGVGSVESEALTVLR